MLFLSTIVSIINTSLQTGTLAAFTPAQYNGIATVLARKTSDTAPLELLPAVVTLGGEYSFVEPKDNFKVVLYHKVLSNNYSYQKKSQGDGYDVKSSTEMALIVFGDTGQLQITADDLEASVMLGLPMFYKAPQFRQCLITPVGSDMDKIKVFRQEYPQSAYFLKPTNILFQVRYRIEASFNQECITG